MIIDAKYRYAAGETRAEETYKLLGYAENFRTTMVPFWGVLCFVGPTVADNSLNGPLGGRLFIARCDEQLDSGEEFAHTLDVAIQQYLASERHE
jgi:hypothetical protein